MATGYPQYGEWTAVPQGPPEIVSVTTPPPHPPKVPIYEVSGGLDPLSNPSLLAKDEQQTENDVASWKSKSSAQRWFSGLHLVLRAYAGLTLAILLVNVGWLIWASRHYGTLGGYGTIQQGDCSVSKSLNLWLHLAINILSTGLLLGSSAFMAAATAPSREEVDLAHRKRKWLSIGLLSFRNLRHVSVKKVLACIILLSTSLPVHLFYNSVIFQSLSGNNYYFAVVTEDFLSGAPFNLTDSNWSWQPQYSPIDNDFEDYSGNYLTVIYQSLQQNASQYERLDNENCIKAYSPKLVSGRRQVVLVSSAKNLTNSILAFDESVVGTGDQTNWICSQDPANSGVTCDTSPLLQDPQNWDVFGFPILYCLSQEITGSCSVKFSSDLAIVIIVCNLIKLCVEVYILRFGGLDEALTCVGDAIASFLTVEDILTRDMCLLTMKEVSQVIGYPLNVRRPRYYLKSRPRWARAISKGRWALSLAILIVAVLLVSILYAIADTTGFASKGYSTSAAGLWRMGFGQVDPEILIASDSFGTPVTVSLLANTPQLILAVIYYLYNGMLNSFFNAQEYSTFALKSQYLRVASPAGNQVGTWFLGMPLAWGMFFLAMQTLLHWFVSQGLFVAEVSTFNWNGTLDSEYSISNCGFSPLAMICAMVLAVIMMLLTIILGLRRFPIKSPPVAGNSSAAISAACHPGVYEEKTAFMALKWASISSWPDGSGHCSLAVARDEDGMGVLMEEVHEGIAYK